MRNILFLIIIPILLFCSCTSNNHNSKSIKIFLIDTRQNYITNTSNDIDSDKVFSYRIEGYGHPNVYVDLIHSVSKEISEINFLALQQNELIDSDTLGFNDWFAIDEEEKTYIVFKADYERLKAENDKDSKIKLYEIYVLARSME